MTDEHEMLARCEPPVGVKAYRLHVSARDGTEAYVGWDGNHWSFPAGLDIGL